MTAAQGAHGAPCEGAARGAGDPASDRAGVRGGAPTREERPKYDNSREETRRLNRRAALVVRIQR
jgi:hypothetical protein